MNRFAVRLLKQCRLSSTKSKAVLSSLFPKKASKFAHENKVADFVSKLRANYTSGGNVQPKRMRDSYVEDYLRFSTDPDALEEYKDISGTTIRVGKILEDIDALAGMIGFTHALDETNKDCVQVVTASLDRIDMLRKFPIDKDIKLSGFVTFVGTSSMEISIVVEALPEAAPAPGEEGIGYAASLVNRNGLAILTAKFIMVAINKETMKSFPVTPLSLETEEDHALYVAGAEHKARKQAASAIALTKKPPNVEEMYLVHDLYLKSRNYSIGKEPKPDNVLFMSGYLMRVAFELAYATAVMACKSYNIEFLALDDLTFRLPVPIGSIISLSSKFVYSTKSTFQISVIVDILNVVTGERKTSNDFYFTFTCKDIEKFPHVLPQSYAESVLYIEAKRRQKRFKELQE
ncbi:hypothetical protein HK103_000601 [Boothiomyces macroporosus]|uniref:HotDog ACOT-type domain-containing protein n=1 Tax=Boothiomyces macroporosus TaxID=261099 RepID=A0AAD5YA71_9FUNG|nr:hypothetical protein HK103_000601 [Boothiomyces macroporosus]